MTQDRATPDNGANKTPYQTPYQERIANSYYAVLGIQPAASPQQIRQAYRDLSKLYHPDTTSLAAAEATRKFQLLNEAYATLSNLERRQAYDQKIGYSRITVVQPLPSLRQTARPPASSSAYLDATDRPLSPGEMFAIFILGLTVVGCLVLAIAIGITRGPSVLDPVTALISPAIVPQPTEIQPVLAAPVPRSDASRVKSLSQAGAQPQDRGSAQPVPRLDRSSPAGFSPHLPSPKAVNSVQVNSVPAKLVPEKSVPAAAAPTESAPVEQIPENPLLEKSVLETAKLTDPGPTKSAVGSRIAEPDPKANALHSFPVLEPNIE